MSRAARDKGGGLLRRRWDETRADECVAAAAADDGAKTSLGGIKLERIRVKLVAAATATETRPAEGETRETSIAPATAPACLVEDKKQ